jgi:uncharacterized ParB-like nuclease family protein
MPLCWIPQIDVLEVDGKIYGFSGCHRYEAHVRLGLPTILCKVRRATPQVCTQCLSACSQEQMDGSVSR